MSYLVQGISFFGYGGYKKPLLHIFNFPKFRFAHRHLHSREGNFWQTNTTQNKKGSMHDEQMKSLLQNNASAVLHITVHYLHFALVAMETETL